MGTRRRYQVAVEWHQNMSWQMLWGTQLQHLYHCTTTSVIVKEMFALFSCDCRGHLVRNMFLPSFDNQVTNWKVNVNNSLQSDWCCQRSGNVHENVIRHPFPLRMSGLRDQVYCSFWCWENVSTSFSVAELISNNSINNVCVWCSWNAGLPHSLSGQEGQ